MRETERSESDLKAMPLTLTQCQVRIVVAMHTNAKIFTKSIAGVHQYCRFVEFYGTGFRCDGKIQIWPESWPKTPNRNTSNSRFHTCSLDYYCMARSLRTPHGMGAAMYDIARSLRAPSREMGSQSLSTKAIWGLFDDARELNFVARDVIHSEIYAI